VARARKDAQKSEQHEKEVREKEDRYWADDDKSVVKKQQRKEEQEKKRQQVAEKKKENARLYDEEQSKLPSRASATSKPAAKTPTAPKVTVASIEAMRQEETRRRTEQQREQEERTNRVEVPPEEIEENLNRVNSDAVIASNVDEAIKALSLSEQDQADRHPEKRMRAAYNAFEERRLPELKQEYPTLRLSQLKQMLIKEWAKSPENPIRQ